MPEPETAAPEDNQPEPDKEPDWKAEAEKWKSLARKHEGTAKANSQAATRLKELEDAGKSEHEKLASERDEHKGRADKAELSLARLEVALEKGLTASQAKRLVGTTREELEADADELLADLKGSKTNGRKPGSFDAGAKDKSTSGDGSSWFADALKAGKR